MDRDDRYLVKAEEAERSAQLARSDDERAAYLDIAKAWRSLEKQRREAEAKGR